MPTYAQAPACARKSIVLHPAVGCADRVGRPCRVGCLGHASDAGTRSRKTLKSATVVDSWDAASREVLDRIGQIPSVIDRTNEIAAIRQMVVNSGFDVRLLLQGDQPLAPSIASRSEVDVNKRGSNRQPPQMDLPKAIKPTPLSSPAAVPARTARLT